MHMIIIYVMSFSFILGSDVMLLVLKPITTRIK